MHIWTIERWKRYASPELITPKSRIQLHCDKNTNEDLKLACRHFIQWVKKEYYFPIPLCINLKKQALLKTRDGGTAVGTFFEPTDDSVLPHIRIATGDYPDLLDSLGRDDVIATILTVIAHEMTHYFQWINALPLTERGRERQAAQYARFILDEYSQTRAHP